MYTVLGLLAATLNVASAYVSALAINIITGRQMDRLALLLGLMFGTKLFHVAFNALKDRVQTRISVRVHTDIQAEIFERIVDVRWDALNRYQHGDLLNRFNDDVKSVSENTISWIPDILINLYTFAVTFAVLYKMDPIMAWIGLCSAPILFFLSRYVIGRQRAYRSKVLELNSDMMSFEAEVFYNMDSVKAFGIWDELSLRLRRWQDKYKKNNLDYNLFQIRTNSTLSLLNILVTLGSFCYCLYRLWSGNILYGDMTFFLSQRGALTRRFDSLMQTLPAMLNAAVSTHRIREIVELPKEEHDPEIFDAVAAKAEQGLAVELHDASFSYREGNNVYKNASFVARPGEIVAVIGESGGGKTPLFRLLLGLIQPEEGEMVLRDSDGKTVKMNADLRRLISYVPQGNTVFLGTIAENMRMVKSTASEGEIVEALKTACAWEFVEPLGLDCRIGERGKGLSEGQAQRLSIARAVLRQAPILLLDEATSALDEETEARVLDNVVRSAPNRTVIVSSHRPSVLKKCSRIYRVGSNRVEECPPIPPAESREPVC